VTKLQEPPYALMLTGRDGVERLVDRYEVAAEALAARDELLANRQSSSWHARVLAPNKVDPPCSGEIERCECTPPTSGACRECAGSGWVIR
jgi:hypothetical protein